MPDFEGLPGPIHDVLSMKVSYKSIVLASIHPPFNNRIRRHEQGANRLGSPLNSWHHGDADYYPGLLKSIRIGKLGYTMST